jgi:hypothetical protein
MTYLAFRRSTCSSGETERCFPTLKGDIILCAFGWKGISDLAYDAWLRARGIFLNTHLIESGELCNSLTFSNFVALGLYPNR